MSKHTSSQSDKENYVSSAKKIKISCVDSQSILKNLNSNIEGKFSIETNNLNKLESDLNNGEYIIYEYCNELINKIQQTKEEQIEKLENLSESLIKTVNDYKTEITNKYLNKNRAEIISNLKPKTDLPILDQNLETELQLKKSEKFIKDFIFDNNFLEFKQNYDDSALLGDLKYKEKNIIDFSSDFIITGSIESFFTENKRSFNYQDHIFYFKHFKNGKCLLAFTDSYRESLIDIFVLDKDKNIKLVHKQFPYKDDTYMQVVNEKFVYQLSESNLQIYDQDLNLLNELEHPKKLRLIGACESAFYFACRKPSYKIGVYNWSFEFQQKIGGYSSYDFGEDIEENIKYFTQYKGNYFSLDWDGTLKIINKYSGNLIQKLEDIESIEIDSNDNLILFKEARYNRIVEFHDLNGHLKNKYKLVNFYFNKDIDKKKKVKNINLSDSDDSDEDFEMDSYFDEDMIWEDTFTFNQNAQLCFFDKKKFKFFQKY
jgi:hypothetical protein